VAIVSAREQRTKVSGLSAGAIVLSRRVAAGRGRRALYDHVSHIDDAVKEAT
jgi:hypothetical protein